MPVEEVWDGTDRRQTRSIPPPPNCGIGPDGEFWRYAIGQFELINARLGSMHIQQVEQKVEVHGIRRDVEEIKKAFPMDESSDGGPDYHGHRGHHDGLIKSSKRWGEIGTEVLKKLFTGIAWVTFVFIVMAIWESVKMSIKK